MIKINKYSIEKEGIQGICKNPVILAHTENNCIPIMYLKKPKYINYKDFQTIVDSIKLELPEGFEIQ